MNIFISIYRVITVQARDAEGEEGVVSTLTVIFDRSCSVFPNPSVLTLATQTDVDKVAVCTSIGSRRVSITGASDSPDPIVSLLPMRNVNVSTRKGWAHDAINYIP